MKQNLSWLHALVCFQVDLTWDETDPERQQLTKRIHDPKEKVDDEDLRAYLASSSDEEDDADAEIKGGSASSFRI